MFTSAQYMVERDMWAVMTNYNFEQQALPHSNKGRLYCYIIYMFKIELIFWVYVQQVLLIDIYLHNCQYSKRVL